MRQSAQYGDSNPIVVKSEFIMSLIEQIDKKGVGPQHKSIIDRCIGAVYRESDETGVTPTLCSLREKLLAQPEPEAKQIALSLEFYTTGSLDIFGKQSNVDLDRRVVVFDTHGLGAQLKPAGLLVITDTMLNRVTLEAQKGDIVVALDDEGQNTLKRYEGYDSRKKMHILGYMNEASYPDRKIEVKELTVQGVAGHVIKKL